MAVLVKQGGIQMLTQSSFSSCHRRCCDGSEEIDVHLEAPS
ncbi:hypothetical protein [Prochlorococcus sp. MIT 1306]